MTEAQAEKLMKALSDVAWSIGDLHNRVSAGDSPSELDEKFLRGLGQVRTALVSAIRSIEALHPDVVSRWRGPRAAPNRIF